MNMRKIALSGLAALAMNGCGTNLRQYQSNQNPMERNSIAAENLRELLTIPSPKAGMVPYATVVGVSKERIKVNCYEEMHIVGSVREAKYSTISFNCGLLDRVESNCLLTTGKVSIYLKSGEECALESEAILINGFRGGCDWAKNVEDNLREYCPDIKDNQTKRTRM